MPSRTRIYTTWTVALSLLVAGAFVLSLVVDSAGGAAQTGVQQAGVSWLLLLGMGMLAGGVSLMTPTVLFVARRRRFRRVLITEGTSVLPLLRRRA